MRKRDVIVVFAAVFASASPVLAAGYALQCEKADVMNSRWNAPIKFVFDGSSLAVSGPFGNFTIPAKSSPMQIEPGVMGQAIDGVAKTSFKLPALADLKACVTKAAGTAAPNSDAYLNAQQDCLRTLNPTDVEGVAQIRLGTFSDGDQSSGEDAFVTFKLRYEDADKTSVEAFPAKCLALK